MEAGKVSTSLAEEVKMEDAGNEVKEGKKKEKKEKKENPKNSKKADRQLAKQMAAATVEVDPLAANYGDIELQSLQSAALSGRSWTKVSQLDQELTGKTVLVRGRVHAVRGKGKVVFLVVRESGYTVQCVAQITENVISKQMIKFISGLNKESIIDVEGEVSLPPADVAASQQGFAEGNSNFTAVLHRCGA